MKNWKQIAIPLISSFEGCAREGKDNLIYPYLDKLAKPNLWTRGYGRTYGITETSPAITKEEALQELGVGIDSYVFDIIKLSPNIIIKPYCLAAIASWTWNCGIGAYKQSRLRKAINSNRWQDACELIKKPRTAGGVEYKGLIRRREAESVIFSKGLTGE